MDVSEKSNEHLEQASEYWKDYAARIRQEMSYIAGIKNDIAERINQLNDEAVEADRQSLKNLKELHKRKTGEEF